MPTAPAQFNRVETSGRADRRPRKNRSSRSRRKVSRGPAAHILSNHRFLTFSAIAMAVIIIEFQGIHEARVAHKKLRELHEKEQSTLQVIEHDLMAVVNQASDAILGHNTTNEQPGSRTETIPGKIVAEFKQPEQMAPPVVSLLTSTTPKASKSQWNLPKTPTVKSLIPPSLEWLGDLSTPFDKSNRELPLFFHLPKSGGTSTKHMYSDCYNIVQACEIGASNGHARDITLKEMTIDNGWRFVNVDTTTIPGIERAARFNLVGSGKADLVVSPLLHEIVPKIFEARKTFARMFAIFREPVDRIVSLFYYLQKATHEPTYTSEMQNMTLDQYVNSTLFESNFVSRTLIDKMRGPLTEQDFLKAKEILRTKCLVGLLDQVEESVRRFDLYFDFGKKQKTPNYGECSKKYLTTGTNRHSHPNAPPTDSLLYKEIARKTDMDIRLYSFIQELFQEQASIFNVPDVQG